MLLISEKHCTKKSEKKGPVNLGNPGEYTMKELAERVLSCLPDTSSTLETRPLPQDDPRRRKPDISKAKKFLKWEPKVLLEEGLRKTVEDFAMRAKRNPKELVCSHQKGAQIDDKGKGA